MRPFLRLVESANVILQLRKGCAWQRIGERKYNVLDPRYQDLSSRRGGGEGEGTRGSTRDPPGINCPLSRREEVEEGEERRSKWRESNIRKGRSRLCVDSTSEQLGKARGKFGHRCNSLCLIGFCADGDVKAEIHSEVPRGSW